MKRIIILIAFAAIATACATTARLPQTQMGQISFNPEDVATGINEGKMVDEVPSEYSTVWEEHSKLFPPRRMDPAWGWSLYDLNGDGCLDHILHQEKWVKRRLKLHKLAIKDGKTAIWYIADPKFIEKVDVHLDNEEYD